MAQRFYLNDTAILEASILEDDGVNPLPATTVSYKVLKPDGTEITGSSSIEQTETTINITDTDLAGKYAAQITFTDSEGINRSVVQNFEVVDPLNVSDTVAASEQGAIEHAWMKLEDIFDSIDGGPWLRDRTKNMFSVDKLAFFVPDALYSINNAYQPATSFDGATFPYTQHMPLLAQAILIESIYHLIRSYAEQPALIGSNINYWDRRDYLTRWQSILTSEEARLNTWLDLFKRDQLGYASTATLIGGYSSYYSHNVPRMWRARGPAVNYRF